MSAARYSKLQKEEGTVEDEEIELQVLPTSIGLEDDGKHDWNDESLSNKSCSNDDKEQLLLYRASNIAIPLNYFMVGLVQGLCYPLLNVYPLDLRATEAQQTTLLTLKSLPSCFKIGFGVLSDSVPIGGLRRKPYLYLGWLLSSLSLVPSLLFMDLTLPTGDDVPGEEMTMTTINLTATTSTTTTSPPQENAPQMSFLCLCFFCWANGVWLADVMGDSLVAEKAKFETNGNHGNTQLICYVCRGVGFVTMAPVSSIIYSGSTNGPFLVILMTALLPVLLVPAIAALHDATPTHLLGTREQMVELWNTASSKAVWQPMGFVFLYSSLFVSNSAWKQFLETVLGFTPNMLNALMVLANVMMFWGLVLYKLVCFQWSLRTLFVIGMVANALFSALQLLLIAGHTLGLPPFLFALGDDAMRDCILGTLSLPMVIMMVHLVPTGIEGASYALFTTTWNVAQSLSDSLSTMLLSIWDVSQEKLQQGDLSGLGKLTVLTTIIQLLPIFFVGMLPRSATQAREHESRSLWGGASYLGIVLFALLWTIFVDLMNIIRPGWMGES